MNVAARSARGALYRDFYDLIPLFSSLAAPSVARTSGRHCISATIKRSISSTACRRLQLETHSRDETAAPPLVQVHQCEQRQLPPACPGCGALTQSVHPQDAGHYTTERAAVKRYLNHSHEQVKEKESTAEDGIMQSAMENLSPELRAQLGFDALNAPRVETTSSDEPPIPICDRCHHLIHHHSGVSINHPSLAAIEATIAESPHKHNHVYHVMDAADFPMSFIPSLTRRLDFAWLRGRNRRAKTQHWSGGKTGQISFIITRSDLLAPKKEQVDQLMPQMREILRDALGNTGKDVRLGNVHLVSSKRGWWTREVKRDVWDRGGANWLVGKANVGKSNIFEVIYPKGTNEATPNFQGAREDARRASVQASLAASQQPLIDDDGIGVTNFQPPAISSTDEPMEVKTLPQQDFLDTSSLLPPAQQAEANYPVMPTISSLPGTTCSPIRIPFGRGKGELIDLPGTARQTLEPYVKPSHHLDLVMKSRVVPERVVIKPGSSLVLGGGLVRITPKTEGLVFMAHAFVPMDAHLTSTAKAVELQSGERDLNIASIMSEDSKGTTKLAGTFKLDSNVTKKYAGPLTRRSDAGLTAARLPFVVWATDILVEGCGWVEIVAQVRKPRAQPEEEVKATWHEDDVSNTPNSNAAEPKEALASAEAEAEWSPMGALGDTESTENLNTDSSPSTWQPTTPRPSSPSTPPSTPTPTKAHPSKDTKARRHPLDLEPEALARTIPEIEVYSPMGKFIGQRPSLSCWLLGGPTDKKTTGRPRRSMKGVKKVEKRRAREGRVGGGGRDGGE